MLSMGPPGQGAIAGGQPPLGHHSGYPLAPGPPQHHMVQPQPSYLGQQQPSQESANALLRAIASMEEKGLQDDPRYAQLLALRARATNPLPSQDVNMQRNVITFSRY